MKNICFITSSKTLMPPIKGGAVAQLIHLICKENEKQPQFHITVISHSNKETLLLQSKFKYTKFINYHNGGYILNKFIWKIRGFLRLFTNKSFYFLHPYEIQVNQYLGNHTNVFDLIIAEACDKNQFEYAVKRYGNSRFCFHAHYVLQSNSQMDYCHGSLISLSKYSLNKYLSTSTLNQKRAFLLHNAIDISAFTTILKDHPNIKLKNQLGFQPDDFVIAFCGRLVPEKGVLELIQAVLSINISKIKLLIIGSSNFGLGNSGKYAQKVLKISKNSDRIKYTGFIPNNKIPEYYKIADIGITPSRCEEGFCLVLLEMMASGLPTIATERGGMTEVATPKTTLFIKDDYNIVTSIKQGILDLYYSPEKRKVYSQNAVERSLLFDKSIYFENFTNIVNNIVEQNQKNNLNKAQ